MNDIIIENLVLSVKTNQSLELEDINRDLPHTTYEPEQLPAIVIRYHDPSRVVIITSEGKIVCTGSKTKEKAMQTLNETIQVLKEKKFIQDSINISPKLEMLVVSKKLNVSLPLESIETKLPADQCTFHPSNHPWLEYYQPTYSLLLFSSGNIICTGKITLEESKDAFKNIENTLLSIGCKIAE